jgi:competence protein ComEC
VQGIVRLFSLAFLLGTCALQQQASLPEVRVVLGGLAALLALLLLPAHARVARGVVLVVAGGLSGFGTAAWRAEVRLADALPVEWEWRDVEVVGVIASLPQWSEKGVRFVFDVERVMTAGAHLPERVSLTWYAERGKGGSDDVAPPAVKAGERWRATVRLKRPRGLANPHGFDFEPWALERGIRATGYVRSREGTERLAAQVDGWPFTLHRWRGEIRDSMQAHLGEARLGGVLVALAIGDQDAIVPEDWETFWRTGVGHLMSISGLHITMLAALAFAIAFFAWVRMPRLALWIPARKVAVVAGTLTALAYALMTGYAVPAQRTFVMLAAIALCVLLERHGSASRVLALAALAVVLLDPWAVLSSGFWLSFGAVGAIFYAMALRTGPALRFHAAFTEQLAVTVIMVPMLVALFQEVSLVSPLANAFAIPIVSLVVVPLALAGAFLPLPFLLDAAHALMTWLMIPLEWLASLPLAMLESHAPAGWTVAAAVVGALWLLAPRGVPMRCAGFVWMTPMFVVLPMRPGPGEAWLDVLDVGHGLAVIVRTRFHALAYDAGPSWSADSDSGSRIVVPFLRGEGVGRLDGLVLSHADDDHYGGAASVVRARHPAWLLSSLVSSDPLHALAIESRRCEAGQRWSWDGVVFDVLHPHAGMYSEIPGRKARKENDRGCVLRVATANSAALLSGDVEGRSEGEMLARDATLLRADVLVVPHHGSKTSSTGPFIDVVAPRWALFSVGYRNRFRHPHEVVVERYRERGVERRRTDLEGALHVVMPAESGGRVSVEGYAVRQRYWSERRVHP